MYICTMFYNRKTHYTFSIMLFCFVIQCIIIFFTQYMQKQSTITKSNYEIMINYIYFLIVSHTSSDLLIFRI